MGLQDRSAGTPLTPEDPPAIGPYELISRLGSGGMGTVYLARAADGARVALKAIRRDYTADPVYRARFHEEVSNARKVASFCTARVLDHGEDGGVLYLVTEYIDGISLEDHLIEHGALSPSVLHSAAVGVAAALTAIHAAGLVHRDLKPANVMLTLAGPRVIDFGLARSAHLSSRHTNAGMVMGTPGWIAPEQVFEGKTSPAGDVFAWGSLIAYAGLGGHPFGEGDAYVMAARARTAPPDLRGLPAPLDRLVAAAIHPDPARRPPARQLLLELVGAADEPAAQLAATRHLTTTWDPADLPPLSQSPRSAPGRPPVPSPGPQAPPAAPPAQPGPSSSTAGRPPQAHQTGQVPLPPQAHQTGQVPLPPPGQPPMPSGSLQQPPHHHTGQGPLPGRPGPAAQAPSHGPGPQNPPSHGPGPQNPPSHGPGPHGPGTRGPSSHGPGGPGGPHGPSSHGPGARGRTVQGPPPGQGPPSGLTGPGPLPPSTMPPPGRPRRGTFTGCLTAVVIALVLLVVLVALIAWMTRDPAVGSVDGPAQDGRLRFAVTGTKCPKTAKSAKLRTCTVSVKVDNIGQEARVLYPGQQKLCDEDDVPHGGTRLLDKAGTEITPVRIGPGQSFSGALVFELPKGAGPAALELHDSGLSHGVRLTLGG
ncbi:protein kinase domain-containing protein [Nonomuraea sp. 3-1Str]|uniref:serine/threonine-protein kinase n=1 Tax=Nonomuraea sp. 3-1Str TaxID=2929801 RepID=UPI00286FFF18|nr:protein kinase [Nonomuraea sp. 3-1Str]